jgi:hypothetical protein
MKAWPSLTDTSVVKIYREVPALRNNAFREFARCLNLLSRNKFANLQNFKPACENVVTPCSDFSGGVGCVAPQRFSGGTGWPPR